MLGFNTKELAVAIIIGDNSRDKPCQQLERKRRWVLGDHLISQPSLLCISSTTKHLKETFTTVRAINQANGSGFFNHLLQLRSTSIRYMQVIQI